MGRAVSNKTTKKITTNVTIEGEKIEHSFLHELTTIISCDLSQKPDSCLLMRPVADPGFEFRVCLVKTSRYKMV